MCLYPKLIKNRKYTATKKNGGVVPAVTDIRTLYVPVGCGDCIECRKQKAREWQVRLLEDIRHNKDGKFLTLTFSNDSFKELSNNSKLTGYELDNYIATYATRHFLERWRKKYKRSLRHWFITELGHNGTENIHIHGIAWTNETKETIEKIWSYGITWVGTYVNEATVNYITKYVTKKDEQHKHYKPIILTSPGIGNGYLKRYDHKNNKYKGQNTNETYRMRNGFITNLPIYWRNKIYNDDEKEKLWLHKLDKMERWICGEKIDISKGMDAYFDAVEHYRNINKRLGYGDGKKDWNRKVYEEELRKIKHSERIGKT